MTAAPYDVVTHEYPPTHELAVAAVRELSTRNAALAAELDRVSAEHHAQADAIERLLADLETARHERDHHAAEAQRLADLLADADDELDAALRCPCNGYGKDQSDA